MQNKLENARVLVIGGAGFIGGFVVKELLKKLRDLQKYKLPVCRFDIQVTFQNV